MPAFRRLMLAAFALVLATAPLRAQTIASKPDLLPAQAPPSSPPASSAAPPRATTTPPQGRPGETSPAPLQSTPFPGHQCERPRPTS